MLVPTLSNDSFNYKTVFTKNREGLKDLEAKINELMLSKFNEKGVLTEKDFEDVADLSILNVAEWGEYDCGLDYIVNISVQYIHSRVVSTQEKMSVVLAPEGVSAVLRELTERNVKFQEIIFSELAEFKKVEKDVKQKVVDIIKEKWEFKKEQYRLAREFYSIFFHDKKASSHLSLQEIDELFKTYLSDSSLSIEIDQEGDEFFKINSMQNVIRFLSNHPQVTRCNFRHFEIASSALPTFVKYLKNSTQVEDVFFLDTIPENLRKAFEEAEEIRNSTDSDKLLGVYFQVD